MGSRCAPRLRWNLEPLTPFPLAGQTPRLWPVPARIFCATFSLSGSDPYTAPQTAPRDTPCPHSSSCSPPAPPTQKQATHRAFWCRSPRRHPSTRCCWGSLWRWRPLPPSMGSPPKPRWCGPRRSKVSWSTGSPRIRRSRRDSSPSRSVQLQDSTPPLRAWSLRSKKLCLTTSTALTTASTRSRPTTTWPSTAMGTSGSPATSAYCA